MTRLVKVMEIPREIPVKEEILVFEEIDKPRE